MSEFKAGQRVRVIYGGNNPVEAGDTGTVTNVGSFVGLNGRRLIDVNWDNGTECGLFNYRLEKIEEATLSVGDRVRILPTPDGTDDIEVPESWVGKEGEVTSIVTDSSFPVQVMTDYGYPQGFKFSEVERVEDTEDYPDEEGLAALRAARERRLKEGDLVRITAHITGQGEVGTLKYNGPSEHYPYRVEGVGDLDFVVVHEHEVEKVEVPEGDNDTEDEQETTVPALDVVNHPPHYKFSNGAEVIDITENLTSNGGQAVQYIARSTRLDGNNKGDMLEDLRKARWFIDREIERVEGRQN